MGWREVSDTSRQPNFHGDILQYVAAPTHSLPSRASCAGIAARRKISRRILFSMQESDWHMPMHTNPQKAIPSPPRFDQQNPERGLCKIALPIWHDE